MITDRTDVEHQARWQKRRAKYVAWLEAEKERQASWQKAGVRLRRQCVASTAR
jgi:hypothetical protein